MTSPLVDLLFSSVKNGTGVDSIISNLNNFSIDLNILTDITFDNNTFEVNFIF